MIGLIFLLVAFFYIGWWIAITYFSYVGTKKLTHSKGAAITVSALFFIVMYLIPFWDWIPTVLAHKHYCEAEAGWKIYKTPEQLLSKSSSMLASLRPYKRPIYIDSSFGRISKVNDNFGYVNTIKYVGVFPVRRSSLAIIDIASNEKVFEEVDFVRGYGSFSSGGGGIDSLKFWLIKDSCFSRSEKVKLGKKYMEYSAKLKME